MPESYCFISRVVFLNLGNTSSLLNSRRIKGNGRKWKYNNITVLKTLITSSILLFYDVCSLNEFIEWKFQLCPDNFKLNYNKLVKNALFAIIHYETSNHNFNLQKFKTPDDFLKPAPTSCFFSIWWILQEHFFIVDYKRFWDWYFCRSIMYLWSKRR